MLLKSELEEKVRESISNETNSGNGYCFVLYLKCYFKRYDSSYVGMMRCETI